MRNLVDSTAVGFIQFKPLTWTLRNGAELEWVNTHTRTCTDARTHAHSQFSQTWRCRCRRIIARLRTA